MTRPVLDFTQVAAFAGHSEVVKWLLARDVPAGVRDKNGGTPLHAAAFAGRLDAAKFLLAAGWAVTKLHGAVKVQFLCAQRRAGVLLNMSAKFWRISRLT